MPIPDFCDRCGREEKLKTVRGYIRLCPECNLLFDRAPVRPEMPSGGKGESITEKAFRFYAAIKKKD